ncbi:MAG: HNH endonuclease [Bradyrhizobium sp.]|nr:HNH endonuclease [Bradyrhizobium sp.]
METAKGQGRTMNPFQHNKRGSMSEQRRAKLFAIHGPRCAECTRKMGPGIEWDLDHILALEKGGTDDDDNFQVLCEVCHARKTGSDHADAGHMRRVYTKSVVPNRFKKSMGWRRAMRDI